MTAPDDMLDCPFCGSADVEALTGPAPHRWGTRCNDCDVWRDDRCDTKAEAIALWNTRAAMTPDAAALVQDMLRDGKLWRVAVNAASAVLNDGVPQKHWASPPKIRLALDAALAALRAGGDA